MVRITNQSQELQVVLAVVVVMAQRLHPVALVIHHLQLPHKVMMVGQDMRVVPASTQVAVAEVLEKLEIQMVNLKVVMV